MPQYTKPFDLPDEVVTLLLRAPSTQWASLAGGFGEATKADLVTKCDARINKAMRLREFLLTGEARLPASVRKA